MTNNQFNEQKFTQGTVYFVHIPKTAGQSLSRILLQIEPAKKYLRSGSFKKYFLDSLFHPQKYSDIILGFHNRYGFHQCNLKHLLGLEKYAYITFLRDPIERAISYYYYVRKERPKKWEHPQYKNAINYDLKDFYLHQPNLQNFETKMLSNPPLFSKLSIEERLAQAKYNLEHKFACFGITERFAESVKLLINTFNWTIAQNNLPTVNINQQRLKREEISPEIIEVLTNLHQQDLQLYSFAVDLFEQKIAQLNVNQSIS